MNVGSILNGDSPSERAEGKKERPPPQPFQYRHSINNLLNDVPTKAKDESNDDQLLSLPDVSHTSRSSIAALTNEIEAELPRTETKKKGVKTEYSSQDVRKYDTKKEKLPKGQHSQGQHSQGQLPKGQRQGQGGQKGNGGADEKRGKNSIVNGELKRLNKLKGPKQKPHRYSEPPIWAREWTPASQQPRDAAIPDKGPSQGGDFSRDLSQKTLFDHSSTYSADLECLITGMIPPQSTIRAVAEWIYANFVKILLENRQYMELELKFGTIVNKDTGARLDIGVSSECIYSSSATTKFVSGVHETGWTEMRNFLEELEKAYQEESRKNPAKPRRKFATTESDGTDYFYHVSERNEMPRKIRITKDNTLTPPRLVGIRKQRLSDLYIHNPSSMYDLRLSMSLEMPVEEGSVEPIMKKNKAALQRMKKRTSWSHAPTVTKFDFTEVRVPQTLKNSSGKAVTEYTKTWELELEIDTYQIFRGFDKIRDGLDSIRFEELVEVFLNNARCLNNRVTKLASTN